MQIYRLCVLMLAVLMLVGKAPAQLPPDIEAERSLVEAERHIGTGDHAAAKAALDRILGLQAAHDLVLPEAFWFQYAEVAYQAGLYAATEEAAARYLTTVGRAGAHYRAALELLDQVEAARQRVAAERQHRAEEQRRAAAAAAAERRRLAQLPRELRNSIGMEFVLIKAGTFQMGSPATEPGRDADEGPVHEVTISQPFYLGKYEVTQGQWQAVMGNNPSHFSDCGGNCPVEEVSWEDTREFIVALNRQEGVNVYRLPTEAEWEYAARAGTQTAYHFGNAVSELDLYAWYGELLIVFSGGTRPVGQKRPNGWGLYDMHGNVWEWVADWYGGYPRGAVTDPRGPSTGAARVSRGGGWFYAARDCRAADRGGGAPGNRRTSLGLRLARTP